RVACVVGPGAFVHYGVTMGDHVVLDADSFLMKGEVLDSHTSWRGNPAKLVRRSAPETDGTCEAYAIAAEEGARRCGASWMSSKVRLEDVTARNWRAVARLKLAPEQEHLVASNLYS